MNIAIIDDESAARQEAADIFYAYIKEYHPALTLSIHVSFFDSAENLLDIFTPGSFDILLMDIYMKDMTGIAAAQYIRHQDEKCAIIFLTTSTDHLLDGYTVFAAGYLLKPLSAHISDFSHVIEHCLSKSCLQENILQITSAKFTINIAYHKIIYIDCNHSRNVSIHLEERVIQTNETYAQIQDILLNDTRFMECYHRVMVNMDYIDVMEADCFLLRNEVRLPISRRKKNQVKAQYVLYLTTK